MSNDTKTPNANSNSLHEGFNVSEHTNRRIAAAAPETKQRLEVVNQAHMRALDDLSAYQERTFEDRVEKARTKLLENYINDPANRMDTPEARQQDMAVIDEQAKFQIKQRDEWAQKNLVRAHQSNVYAILNIEKDEAQINHKPEIEPEIDE